MKARNSSYYQMFRLTIVIVASVLILLGVFVTNISSHFFRKEQLEKVKASGDLFISCITDEYSRDKNNYIQSANYLCEKISCEQEVRIFLFNSDGICISSHDGDLSKKLNRATISELEKDDILGLSSKYLSQSVPSFNYITKAFFRENDGKYTPMYVLAAGTTEESEIFIITTVALYSTFALIFFIGCFLVLRRKLKATLQFEEEFLRILEEYSKDNFAEKLSTDISPNFKRICDLVNTLASNVEKSEETSSTFISNVSHELRTPMTTIGGFVDGILDGTIKKSRQQEYLILVSQEIQRLRILISSMLNMSRFEAGTLRPNFQETNLTELVIKVVLMFEKRIEEKKLEIEELDSSRLFAVVDADLMQQVIYNLVENAVKFVNEGGTLSFTFEEKEDMCTVGIKNTGEGLKDSEIEQVFNRFYKTDSSRGKDKTGLGLGLSISRKIVHLHNGHIVVKSVYGEYTEFLVQIPNDCTKKDKDKQN